MTPATLPPTGLAGLDPRWSRLVTATDAEGMARTWHLLDRPCQPDDSTEPSGNGPEPSAEHPGQPEDRADGQGDGPAAGAGTILCVHGNPTWSYTFRSVLAAPPSGWRVVAPDHLDMGYSERTGTHRPLARRIDDLGRLTEALGITGPVVLLAHDWGGPIALGWALAHPEQTAGLVLTNTAVHHPDGAPAPALIRTARQPGLIDAVTVRTPAFLRGATALAHPALSAEVRHAYAAPYATAERRAAIGGFVRDIPLEPDHPTAPTLAAIAAGLDQLSHVPTLLLWGPRDPVFQERYLHDLAARLPHADVHRVEGAGHLVPEDADLPAALHRWLPARVTSDGPGSDIGSGTDSNLGGGDEGDEADRQPMWSALFDPARAATDAIVEPPTSPGAPPERISFGQLADDVRALAVGLHQHGVRPGDRVASMVTPGRELATLLNACWRLGAIIVVADAGLGPAGLSRALRSAAPDHLVGIDRALAAATALRWPGQRIAAGNPPAALRRAAGATVSLAELTARGAAALAAADELSLLPPPPPGEAEAAVGFTSGSTGPAKGVLYRHRQLEAQRDALRSAYGITDQDRLVAAFAPFALYGPAMGITSMVPDMDVTEPASLTATALADAVAAVDATLVFASPAALANVARTAGDLRGDHHRPLGGVRLLLSAGAPVPAPLLRRLSAVVPAAEPHTPYGMTEALPVADIDLATIEAVGPGDGVCVGHPLTGVDVAISALDDTGAATGALTTEPGVVGEVCVRAAHVKERYDRLALTELDSGRNPGWHRSGDVGHLDADGRLWIGGRLAHLITTADGPVTPVGIEQRVETIEHITMAAAVGVGPTGTQQVVVVVATDPPAGRRQLAPLTLVDRVRAAVDVDVAAVLAVPALPVDIRHQSKIDRGEVARQAAEQLAGRGIRRRRSTDDAADDAGHSPAGQGPTDPVGAGSGDAGPVDDGSAHAAPAPGPDTA